MTTLTRPIRTYPLTFFIVFACLLGWVQYIAVALGVQKAPPDNVPFGVIIAAAIVAASMGRIEWKEWVRTLMAFRTSLGWYALAILAPVVVIVAAVLANHALGAPLPTPAQLAKWPDLAGWFVFFLIFVGIGEEGGWTAFAAPQLLNRRTFITAWVILSAMRVLWHLPLMITGQLPWVEGLGGNTAFQFLALWIFMRSGGVWFLAALWHTVVNTTGGHFFFQMVQGEDKARLGILMTAGYVLLAAIVFLVDRRRLVRASEVDQLAL
jgi:membrane protease YdiL (CAAX protease family)